ncbi:MAG: hypothetical protein NT069_21960 [Planctomycetota bacterium]|nr:hypothetical protein [Planctomycetota bacterium]
MLLVAVVAAFGGCHAFDSSCASRLAIKPDDEDWIDRLDNARSLEQVDAVLQEIVPGGNGQRNVELLISEWGKHGSWFDLAVVRYIWTAWPSGYGKWQHIDSGPLMSLASVRLRENGDLLPQVFWYALWEWNGLEFNRLCQICESPGPCVKESGEEFRWILFIAGALREPNLVEFDPPRSTEHAWHRGSMYFLSQRPFLRFDSEQFAYLTDHEAKRDGQYLMPNDQQSSVPSTPLPKWDSDVVPTRMSER